MMTKGKAHPQFPRMEPLSCSRQNASIRRLRNAHPTRNLLVGGTALVGMMCGSACSRFPLSRPPLERQTGAHASHDEATPSVRSIEPGRPRAVGWPGPRFVGNAASASHRDDCRAGGAARRAPGNHPAAVANPGASRLCQPGRFARRVPARFEVLRAWGGIWGSLRAAAGRPADDAAPGGANRGNDRSQHLRSRRGVA